MLNIKTIVLAIRRLMEEHSRRLVAMHLASRKGVAV